MKKKRILALFLAAVSCLSLAVSASAANTVNRKATDFHDFDKSAWYAEAVSAAVDNGLLYAARSGRVWQCRLHRNSHGVPRWQADRLHANRIDAPCRIPLAEGGAVT